MPQPDPPPRRRRPAARRAPPRQHSHQPVPEPQGQVRRRIINGLHDTIGSCEDLFAQHGPECDCELCRYVSNLVGSLRIFHLLLEIT